MTAFGSKPHRKAPGFVLVGVLIVVMLLSMIALSLMFRMRSEETAGATGSTAEQGWATAFARPCDWCPRSNLETSPGWMPQNVSKTA